MSETNMTNAETAAHLRRWVADRATKSYWSWPSDGCGYDQHMRYAAHRNAHYDAVCAMSEEEHDAFVLAYAASLEAAEARDE